MILVVQQVQLVLVVRVLPDNIDNYNMYNILIIYLPVNIVLLEIFLVL